MKWPWYSLYASIIAAICCGAPSSAQTTKQLGPSSVTCATIDQVAMLDPNFDPTSATSTPTSTAAPVPDYIKGDLTTASNRAAPYFRSQLCVLDGIYITPNLVSWGFRNIHTKKRYIAISQSLWAGSNPALVSLVSYANTVLNNILPLQNDTNPPNFDAVQPNDPTMTLLAVLAHEFGHVLWNDILVDPPGTDPNFSLFCPGIFPTASWAGAPGRVIWRTLGDIADSPLDLPDDPNSPVPSGDPDHQDIRVDRLLTALNMGKFPRAHKILARLLSVRRPWPSLLAAFSVNEDFVESFTLYTLTQATPPLSSLELTIPISGQPIRIDIPATVISRPLVAAKLLCFDDWFARHP